MLAPKVNKVLIYSSIFVFMTFICGQYSAVSLVTFVKNDAVISVVVCFRFEFLCSILNVYRSRISELPNPTPHLAVSGHLLLFHHKG